jgi:uncharacterized protein involved in type VI secretion and phage assembly
MNECERYYGKYRGVVLHNIDPKQEGRLLVQVPDVAGLAPATWAMPCVPVGGLQGGMVALPVIGSGVWVEFEQGDPDHPVWVGTFWGSAAEVPALSRTVPPGVPSITLQTPLQNGIVISDGPAGILIQNRAGASILITDAGIVLTSGSGAVITLTGNVVDINAGALTVT